MDELLTDLLDAPAAPPPHMSFADKMQKAKTEMVDLFVERTHGKNVWLVVLIDATSSMEHHMRQSCGGVMSMFRALRHDLDCTLQVATVAYRDPIDRASDVHESFEFTHKQVVFQKQMKDLKCFGGGDGAEDVAGGLALAVEMLKKVPRDGSAILCHVADAPAHGVSSDHSDNHDTDEQRDALAAQLRALREHVPEDFEYLYFPVGSYASSVGNLHRAFCAKHLGTEWVHTYMRACKPNDFQLSFVSSVFESVASSATAARAVPAPMRDLLGLDVAVGDGAWKSTRGTLGILRACVRDVQAPVDTKTFVRDLTAYAKPSATEASFFGSFMSLSRHMAAPPGNDPTQRSNVVLSVAPNPMGRGAEHHVYHAAAWRDVPTETQDAMCTSSDEFERLQACRATRMVVKVPHVVHDPGFAESKMAVHVPAIVFASLLGQFAKRLGWTDVPEICVVAPTVVSFADENVRLKKPSQSVFVQTKKLREHILVAEPFLKGDFVKMWDNAGRRNTVAFEQKPQLKILFPYVLLCYVLSDGNYVPSDLQGTLDTSTTPPVLSLTDLAATCANPLAFQESRTNLGEPVLRKMVHDAHKAFKDDPKYAELFGPTGLLKHAHAILEKVAPMKKRARA